MLVNAVLVTHRHVDLQPIRNTLRKFGIPIVWDNELGPNMGPFGRFLGAGQVAKGDAVYTQDDDCTTDPDEIVSKWKPGTILCNMGTGQHGVNYTDKLDKLMGFGCVFERSLIKPTFDRYFKVFPFDDLLLREAGRIFTALNHTILEVCHVPVSNLPWAEAPDRLYHQPNHTSWHDEVISRCRYILGREKRDCQR